MVDMSDLSEKKCIPCKGSEHPLTVEETNNYLQQLLEWTIEKNHHLEKSFKFKNFKEALLFTNIIGQIAESEGHHPDIFLSWGKVDVTLFTHKIKGLSHNDFILAAKIDLAKEKFNPEVIT